MSIKYLKKITIYILGVIIIFSVGCKSSVNDEVSLKKDNVEKQREQIEIQGQPETEIQKVPKQDEEIYEVNNNFQWPKDFILGIPELNGKISSLVFDIPRPEDEVQEPQFVHIELVNIEEDTVDRYIEELKAGGYIENSIYAKNSEHTKYYSMNLPTVEGNRVYLKWFPTNKSVVISILKPGWLALEAYLFSYGDDTGVEDLSPWPTGFIPNYPEPKGKIVDVDYFESDTKGIECTGYNISLYYGDRQSVVDCIHEMKKRYIFDSDEEVSDKQLIYTGLSEFYGNHKFDSANIYYYNSMGTTIQGGFELGERYNIISVYMSKAK